MKSLLKFIGELLSMWRPPPSPPPVYGAALKEGFLNEEGHAAIEEWLNGFRDKKAEEQKKVVAESYELGVAAFIKKRKSGMPTDIRDVQPDIIAKGQAAWQAWMDGYSSAESVERADPLVKHAEQFGAMAFAVKYPQEAPPEIVAMGYAIIDAWHRGYKDALYKEENKNRYVLKERDYNVEGWE